MDRTIIELMDDMHLSSQSNFLDYYYAMQSNNISAANSIILNNPSLQNQIMNSTNINRLINGVNARELQPKEDIDYFLDRLYNDFLKMIDNTRVMGNFDETKQYYNHNLVYYQGKGYYALQNPPIGTLPTDNTYWMEFDIRGLQGYGGIDLNFRFNWDSTQPYNIGDVVIYQNKMWYAIANNTNYAPNLNHYPWVVISMPKMPNKTPIQRAVPTGYDTGDFWFQITSGDEVITTTWEIRQPEPTPRFASSSFSVGSNIYVSGGILSNFTRTNINEMFDTETGTWSIKASSPTERARTISFSIGNKGYVVGGQDNSGNVLDLVEIYDSTTNSWSTGASYPIPIVSCDGVSAGGLGYIVGGETTNNVIVADSYSYNPSTDSWTKIANKPTLTYGHTLATDGNNLFAIGGVNSNRETLGINEAYNIDTNTWSQKAEMTVPRSLLSSFTQAGKVFAVGGINSDWYSLNINEKYDIETNVWVTDMPMNYARSSLNSVVSGNHGYAIGGIDIGVSGIYGYVEEYNIVDFPSSFEMIINTLYSTSGSKTISIPMVDGGSYNYWIDWGDGTTSTEITSYNDPAATHTYGVDGEYRIKLMGSLDALKFTDNMADCLSEIVKCELEFYSIDNMFENCINLSAIPDDIFSRSLNITSANSTFYNCSSFSVIPVGLFNNNINITSFNSTFQGSGITSIPTDMFGSNNLVNTFSNVFRDCIHLIYIPSNLFRNCSGALFFDYAFSGCVGLEEIPDNLFVGNPEATDYQYVFENCNKITEIPSNIFGEGAVSVNNFEGAFSGMSIDALPDGLFQYASSATNYNNVFANNNPDITYLSNNLFNGTNATYEDAFDSSIIEIVGDNALNGLAIKPNIFDGDLSLTTVGNDALWSKDNVYIEYPPTLTFRNCSSLTSIGNINLKGVSTDTDLSLMFYRCSGLTDISGFFYGEDNEPTLAQNIDFSSCPLTRTSLMNIYDSLVTNTPSTIKTLKLGAENLNKLTNVEKLLIINKYWNLDGFDPASIMSVEIAKELVQRMHGVDGYSPEFRDETSLYYYVSLKQTDNWNYLDSYAVDFNTGMVYDRDKIPIQEYLIKHSSGRGADFEEYVSKGEGNDKDGAILKEFLQNHIYPYSKDGAYEYIVIGNSLPYDGDISKSPDYKYYAGLENIEDAYHLFEGFNMQNLTIYGKFKPKRMTGTFANTDFTNTDLTIMDLDMSECEGMSYTFSNSKGFDNIRLFDMNNPVTWYPTILTTIDTSNVKDMNHLFYNSTYSTAISDWSFLSKWNTHNVEDMSYMFYYCDTMSEMAEFDMSNVKNAKYMYGLTRLTKLKGNIIGNKLEDAMGMFFSSKVERVPDDATTLFGHNNNLKNVRGLFSGCLRLNYVGTHNVLTYEEDPEGLMPGDYVIDPNKINNQIFTYCPNITDAAGIFQTCASLGDIPMGAFYHCPNIKDLSHAFQNASITIPVSPLYVCQALFVNNLELTNISYLFSNTKITGFLTENVDSGYFLFPGTKIENAKYLWSECTMTEVYGYENIPFIYNSPVLKDISYMFANQTCFRALDNMFSDYSNYSWNKLNEFCPVLENCDRLFYADGQLTGHANKLINVLNKIPTLTNHAKAFTSCLSLSDYNSIPSDWK